MMCLLNIPLSLHQDVTVETLLYKVDDVAVEYLPAVPGEMMFSPSCRVPTHKNSNKNVKIMRNNL